MKRRLLIVALVVILLAGITTALWTALNWPPPRLILKYGLPPAGGPTGRTKMIAGMEFVEVAPGYCWVDEPVYLLRDDVLGWVRPPIGRPMVWRTEPIREGQVNLVEDVYWHEPTGSGTVLLRSLYVKEWTFPPDGSTSLPTDLEGIGAQNNDDPEARFFTHAIVMDASTNYDPSYGTGPFSSLGAWQASSVDGIKGKPIDAAGPTDPWHYYSTPSATLIVQAFIR